MNMGPMMMKDAGITSGKKSARRRRFKGGEKEIGQCADQRSQAGERLKKQKGGKEKDVKKHGLKKGLPLVTAGVGVGSTPQKGK